MRSVSIQASVLSLKIPEDRVNLDRQLDQADHVPDSKIMQRVNNYQLLTIALLKLDSLLN